MANLGLRPDLRRPHTNRDAPICFQFSTNNVRRPPTGASPIRTFLISFNNGNVTGRTPPPPPPDIYRGVFSPAVTFASFSGGHDEKELVLDIFFEALLSSQLALGAVCP